MRRSWRALAGRAEFEGWAEGQLAEARRGGTFKTERVLASPQRARVAVLDPGAPHHASMLNFCANNYLGLANHPALVSAAQRALAERGFGMASVRFICGTQDLHKQLEQELAAFHGKEDAILFPSAFDANGGLFETLLTGEEDVVISDELNHASIIDGIRLCKATRRRYKHRDLAELEQHLAAGGRRVLIATDGVFSMDGTIAPMRSIMDLARRYGALVMVDECHATGFLGKGGVGTAGLDDGDTADVVVSTLGKALGGATGGYVASSAAVVALLRQRARPYLFSNAVAPSVAAASLEALRIVRGPEGAQLRSQLEENVARFRGGLQRAGLRAGGDARHPICPVLVGDAALAAAAAARLQRLGVLAVGFSHPVVPLGKARIRVQISAAHSSDDIDKAVAAFAAVKKEFNF